jgi:hypothetical protein
VTDGKTMALYLVVVVGAIVLALLVRWLAGVMS